MERKAEDVLEAFIPTLVIGHELGTPAQVYSTDVAPVLVSDYDMPSGADDGDAVIMHSKLYDLFGLHLKREFMVSSPNSFFIAIKRVTKLTTFRPRVLGRQVRHLKFSRFPRTDQEWAAVDAALKTIQHAIKPESSAAAFFQSLRAFVADCQRVWDTRGASTKSKQPSTSGAKRAYDATAHLPPAKRPALPPGPGHKPKAAGAAGGAAKRLLTIDVGSGVVGTSYGPSSPEELAAAARVLQQAHARALASRSVQHAARSHHHNVLGARRPHMLLSTGNKAPPSPSSGPHRLSLPLHTAAAATGISLTASLRHASDVAAAPSKPALLDLIDHVSDLDPHHLFLFPVTNAVAPDYYRVVRRPLDLTTLRARVMQGRYSTWAAFSDDVTTMIANALRYFAEGSECQRIASDLLPKAKELLATASASAAAAAADDGGDPRDSAAAAAVIAPAPLKSLTSEEGAAAAALAAMAAGSGCSPIGAHARPAFGAALDSIVALAPNGGPTAGAAAAATAAVAVPGGGGSSGGAVSLTPPSLSPVSSLAAPLGAVAAVAAAPATPPPPLQQRNSGPVVSVPLTSLVVTANGALKMQLPPGVLGAPARPNGSPVTAAAAVAGAQTVTTGLSPHAPRTVVPVQASPVPSLPPALAAVAPLPSAVASIVGSIPPGGPGSALPPLIHFTAGAEEGATSSSGPAMTRAGTAAAAAARKELCVLTEELLAEPGSKLAAIVEAATAANPARRMPHLATANVELLESFVLMHLRCVEQHADSDFLGILPDDANQLGRLSAEAQALRLPRLAARVSQKVAALGSGA